MSKSKIGSFEKINKIGKSLGRLIKKRKRNVKLGMIGCHYRSYRHEDLNVNDCNNSGKRINSLKSISYQNRDKEKYEI